MYVSADRYELRYSTNRSELILESGGHQLATPQPNRGGTTERMEFSVGQAGLEYNTKYYFAVRAFHGRYSRYSNAVPAAVPEPATETPPLTAGGGVGMDGDGPLDGPTRGTFSLTAGVVGNQRAALLVIIAGVVCFIIVTVVITLCVCAARKRRVKASGKADKEAGAKAPGSSNAPDVVASLEKAEWDSKLHGMKGGSIGSQEPTPVMTPDGTGVHHSFMAASQILNGQTGASTYYAVDSGQNGYPGGQEAVTTMGIPTGDYGLEYGAYFSQGYQTYDPSVPNYAVHGANNVNGYTYGMADYNTLETQRLVASSSDRMSYQSSQQSDSSNSGGSYPSGEGKKFVHFSADTLTNGGAQQQQQHYGTYPAGLKGPPPPVPPKPGYGTETRLNESHCSVGSIDHKKVRTVTQV
jgi:hypothetical protein